ncbi:MAG TPA: DNA-3-methyladenine glycosylase [Candidatus Acidoferrales bacterium]|nr:DNA-3-methyladenine glycosylase [Candidatus Acidoferrales bacterium]
MRAANPGKRVTGRSAPTRKGSTQAEKSIRRLRRSQLPSETTKLARYLIGKTVVHDRAHGRLAGRIVETEAYPVGDAAGHAFSGLSAANRSLFLPRGHAYVRLTYGSCWIFNVSSETRGMGAGVLIRAIEPLEGIGQMMRLRRVSRVVDLARGPGRLSEALQINKHFDGVDLCDSSSPLWLGTAARPTGTIGVSTRIGLSREAHRKLRFYERGNHYVSGPRRLRR